MTMTIGKRVAFGFVTVVGITAGLGFFFFTRLNAIHVYATEIHETRLPSLSLAGQLESQVRANLRMLLEYVYTTDKQDKTQLQNDMRALSEQVDQLSKDYEGSSAHFWHFWYKRG